MMKCRNCKYWERHTILFGWCQCQQFQYSTDCYHDNNDENPNFTSDMLIYSDYEGRNASFAVGQDFGCIHYERKNL